MDEKAVSILCTSWRNKTNSDIKWRHMDVDATTCRTDINTTPLQSHVPAGVFLFNKSIWQIKILGFSIGMYYSLYILICASLEFEIREFGRRFLSHRRTYLVQGGCLCGINVFCVCEFFDCFFSDFRIVYKNPVQDRRPFKKVL